MNAHVIENGIVTNTIMVDSLDVFPNLIEATEGTIGWLWDGVSLTPPVVTPEQVTVPQVVTMRQAELALLAAELLDDIEALIPTLSRVDQISWTRASTVERNNPLVAYIQSIKGLSDTDIDNLFIQAAGL